MTQVVVSIDFHSTDPVRDSSVVLDVLKHHFPGNAARNVHFTTTHPEDGPETAAFQGLLTEKGGLKKLSEIQRELDTREDGYLAIKELYGMVWALAEDIANEQSGAQAEPKLYVDYAHRCYERGLKTADESVVL